MAVFEEIAALGVAIGKERDNPTMSSSDYRHIVVELLEQMARVARLILMASTMERESRMTPEEVRGML